MKVRFYESGVGVESVAISTNYDGKDEVHRMATPEDRRHFKAEYAAFRPPLVPAKPESAATPVKSTPKRKE